MARVLRVFGLLLLVCLGLPLAARAVGALGAFFYENAPSLVGRAENVVSLDEARGQ